MLNLIDCLNHSCSDVKHDIFLVTCLYLFFGICTRKNGIRNIWIWLKGKKFELPLNLLTNDCKKKYNEIQETGFHYRTLNFFKMFSFLRPAKLFRLMNWQNAPCLRTISHKRFFYLKSFPLFIKKKMVGILTQINLP